MGGEKKTNDFRCRLVFSQGWFFLFQVPWLGAKRFLTLEEFDLFRPVFFGFSQRLALVFSLFFFSPFFLLGQ